MSIGKKERINKTEDLEEEGKENLTEKWMTCLNLFVKFVHNVRCSISGVVGEI